MIDDKQNPMRPGYFMNYAENESEAEMVLRKLACWLGVGGYNAPAVDAKLFHEKIVDGVNTAVSNALQAKDAEIPALRAEAELWRHVKPGFCVSSLNIVGMHYWTWRGYSLIGQGASIEEAINAAREKT